MFVTPQQPHGVEPQRDRRSVLPDQSAGHENLAVIDERVVQL
jgi:hypothetical protein